MDKDQAVAELAQSCSGAVSRWLRSTRGANFAGAKASVEFVAPSTFYIRDRSGSNIALVRIST